MGRREILEVEFQRNDLLTFARRMFNVFLFFFMKITSRGSSFLLVFFFFFGHYAICCAFIADGHVLKECFPSSIFFSPEKFGLLSGRFDEQIPSPHFQPRVRIYMLLENNEQTFVQGVRKLCKNGLSGVAEEMCITDVTPTVSVDDLKGSSRSPKQYDAT